MSGEIVVLYRWRIHEGAEATFRAAWLELTEAIRRERGSLGSRLHRASDGSWVAYALWPSREQLVASRAQPSAAPAASERMGTCVTERFAPLELETTDDLLAAALVPAGQ